MTSLRYALYLACSWTWCIGMWLPTLLVRDAGKAGFLAFFIPNVIGAASVGWLLAGRAKSFFESKKPIILAFTAVTIAFHGYWITTRFANPIADLPLELIGGALVGSSVVFNAISLTKKPRGLAAAVTLLFSLGAAVALTGNEATAPWLTGSPFDLAGLAAVCLLGFGLCPYLDLTFNKAAIESKRPRLIFTLGFIVFGLFILLVTRGRVTWNEIRPDLQIDIWTTTLLIGGHFGAQTTFTCAAHAEALKTTNDTRLKSCEGIALIALPAAIGLILAVGVAALEGVRIFDMSIEEAAYRAFLAAYGLVFPVWLLLTLGNRPTTNRRTLTALAVICGAALPFFTYGFIALEEVWLLPGVAIVTVGTLIGRRFSSLPLKERGPR